jgi:hypothetical protein
MNYFEHTQAFLTRGVDLGEKPPASGVQIRMAGFEVDHAHETPG